MIVLRRIRKSRSVGIACDRSTGRATSGQTAPRSAARPSAVRVLAGSLALLLGTCTALGLAGCQRCGLDPWAAARVGGATPYLRCAVLPASEDKRGRWPGLRWQRRGRALRIEGWQAASRLLAFTGPAPSSMPYCRVPGHRQAALRDATLLLVLGNLGDSPPAITAFLQRLARWNTPALLHFGGRDDLDAFVEAWSKLAPQTQRLFLDTRGLQRFELAGLSWSLVHGSYRGRYSRTPASCGFARQDIEAHPSATPSALLSWATPAVGDWPAAHRAFGLDPREPALTPLWRRLDARFGLHAWPVGGPAALAAGRGPAAVDWRAVEAKPLTVPHLCGGLRLGPGEQRMPAGVLVLRRKHDASWQWRLR